MPHAETDTMGSVQVNGDVPYSKSLSHLTSYPVVSDTISTLKSNPYTGDLGKQALDIADASYDKFAKPVLPYLQGPYSVVEPLVKKTDALADQGLGKFDEVFPIVKEDSAKIKDSAFSYATYPIKLAQDGSNYVLSTYTNEYKKCGGEGINPIAGTKALISSSLIITSETLAWLSGKMKAKKEEAKQLADDKLKQ